MAYDSGRARVVLFGGEGALGHLGDTWEWNGSNWTWTPVSSTGPAARREHAMAYDSGRGRVVLFGGEGAPGAYLVDTWEWDRSSWTPVSIPGPGARWGHAMAYDRSCGRVVLFGGYDALGVLGDTWEWDGRTWMQVSTTGPAARFGHAVAHDSGRGRVVLFGGSDPFGKNFGDTWEWDGSSWTQVSSTGPDARSGHAMAYDSGRGRVVLFGGGGSGALGCLGDTWEWDGSSWTWTQVSATGPSARAGNAMAYDSGRGRVVLFGGSDPFGKNFGDAWEWDGSSWTQVSSTGPDARSGHAMAYDSGRGRVVLFGGYGLGDTWEWDGSRWTWTQVSRTGPAARYSHAMAYDSGRGRVVLFGGRLGLGPPVGDTWEYDMSPERRPAIQFDVSFLAAGIALASLDQVVVRAYSGATFAQGNGATFLGWSSGYGVHAAPGEWVPLAANATAAEAQAPYLVAAPASLIEWRSSSGDEARRFIAGGGLSFQLRPSGSAGPDLGGSRVALDYIEVRVKYSVP
jgi:hypothetical protein